jgi:hypothetical protein
VLDRGHPPLSGGKIWAVDVIAAELEHLFAGAPFVFGGDLNSARSFDGRPGFGGNVRLHENLAAGGFHDLRFVCFPDEQQTYFKAGKRPDQVDHVFADGRPRTTLGAGEGSSIRCR